MQSTSEHAKTLRHAAEELAGPLPGLLVEAERVANTVAFGIHGRRRVGQGETFWQYRHYMPGDARNAIDWRKSARAPKNETLFVRDNEWEAAKSIFVFADRSSSMRYRSRADHPEKSDAAAVMTLALSLLLVQAGERIANLAGTTPATTGRAAFNRLAREILDGASEEKVPVARKLPAHARVVLVSDFLEPLDVIRQKLDALTAQGITGHMVQICDPAEETFPFTGRQCFEAPGGGPKVTFGRSENLKEDYRRVWLAHRTALADRASRTGWTFVTHRTDRPPEAALLSLYLDLAGGDIRRALA
jgi:uncharacterized protein (DUF58 family)